MPTRTASLAWGAAFLLLAALAIPWFLWNDSTVVAGLPVWLWWHVGWMVLASITFAVFTQHGWGVWMGGWSA
ncbi:DUF3311 domain-containing protein [Halolamina rubra]|uniref:DUF3311 domain-containing protein n=1 Tax=Halolamina rubra TaxID=1380430 RepID=UPI000678D989|nr:DUF3311 domain-containing protein [Halolamina rubra]